MIGYWVYKLVSCQITLNDVPSDVIGAVMKYIDLKNLHFEEESLDEEEQISSDE